MKIMMALVAAALWLGLCPLGSAQAQEAPSPGARRYALVIGSNDGGEGRAALRYGTTDAETFARVMEELGGVQASDRLLLLNPDRDGVQQSFAVMGELLRQGRRANTRQELVVYYSGHSDDQGLLLFGRHYPYGALREAINALPADVRIAILDSCASGAVTRSKGGVRRPAFLVDEASSVKGYAFLTSASESEAAQESDQIGASFFTHYLISGLRGAADVTRDGQVTLNEAYQFAFHETLARTETSRAGAQHPAYDMQLSGTGDLVLTDLRATSASLIVSEEVDGRLYVRDARGKLVAELFKPGGRAIELGLAAGEYQVTIDDKGQLRQASLTLKRGAATTLTSNELAVVVREATRSRGDEAEPEGPLPISVTLAPGVGLAPLGSLGGDHSFALNLTLGVGHDLRGVEVGGVGNWRDGEVRGTQVAGAGNVALEGLQGVQVGGAFNLAGVQTQGVQVAGAFNLAEGADDLVQVAGAFNIAEGAPEFQVAGAFNMSRGAPVQLQVGGAFNLHQGGVDGAQVAGAFNVADGPVRGLQLAGALNLAPEVSGLQLGVVNVGGRVRGAQVGVINLSEDADVTVGLINYSQEGLFHARAWVSDIYPVNVGVQMGGRYVYTILGYAYRPDEDGDYHTPVVGLGGHIPLVERLSLEIDVLASNPSRKPFQQDYLQMIVRARVAVVYEVFEHLGVFGGVAQNVLVQDSYLDRPSFVPGYSAFREESGGYKVESYGWPGIFAGVQF
jgi:hypothetical protein